MSIARERLSQEESRSVALEAARRLLIEEGPQAVTLKAVGARIGRTHANLLHHFGSAAGLQAALARSIAESVTGRIGEAVERARRGEADPREIVDRTFDAFDKEGAGALAAWMILSGNRDALDPILASIRSLVDSSASSMRSIGCPRARCRSCSPRSAMLCSARRSAAPWACREKRPANSQPNGFARSSKLRTLAAEARGWPRPE
jgi:AcrR family transcriptional regulator